MDGSWKLEMVMQIEKGRLMEITPQELAQYDGKEGRPAYVAVHNVVYDVSGYAPWAEGIHFGIIAGTDATKDFDTCHSHTILERLKIVGKLVQ